MLLSKLSVNSFCVSLLICANPIAWYFPFVPNVLVVIVFFSALIFACVNRSASRFIILLVGIILFLFGICITVDFQNQDLLMYFASFIVLGISGLFFASSNFCYFTIYRNIVIVSFCMIPLLAMMDMGDPAYESVDYGHWMGVSYGTLRLVNALILFLLIYKKINVKSFFIVIALFFYLSFYMFYASRGAILSVFLFAFFLFFIKKNYSNKKILFLFFSFSFFFMLILLNLELILIWIADLLRSLDIHVLFIDKTLKMFVTDSLSNGRDELSSEAWNGFLNSPLLGHGIAGFEAKYGRYPHNLFLQVLYEVGLVGFIPLALLFIYSLLFIFDSRKEKDKRIFLAYLFTSGVVELLFSSVYWRSQIFWFYVGYVIMMFTKNNNIKLRNECIDTKL